ncbi:hypothetical protein BV25DRAFT_1831186 [Artomyces pyxidatus]|uniref:Uncharacterized protein n=1 Tax=Artomyces pyxidatus TaxID=48021 RepID=A0ACB8SLW1_9AGAM|nr:hypothetical protein BV25DRAFT_1831186 [Artomyces pyxidatus]
MSRSETFSALAARLDAQEAKVLRAIKGYQAERKSRDFVIRRMKAALTEVCNVAREGSRTGALNSADLTEIVWKGSGLEHAVATIARRVDGLLDDEEIPLSCGNDVTDDSMAGNGVGSGLVDLLSNILNFTGPPVPPRHAPGSLEALASVAGNKHASYNSLHPPSVYTSLLARFNFSVNRPVLPPSTPIERRAFAEGRCEVETQDMWLPLRLDISDTMLAVVGIGGMMQNDPLLELIRLDAPPKEDQFSSWGVDIPHGLALVSMDVKLDDSRRLLHVADEKRIKTFRWAESGDHILPVHTMDAEGYNGPAVLRNGGAKILRSGVNGLAIWDVDTLPTHGPTGKKRIGKRIRDADLVTQRDETDEIERSSGTPPTQTIVGSALAKVTVWRDHPSNAQEVITQHLNYYGTERVNFETQQVVSRYLGHSAHANDIVTSKEDPHSFVTVGRDGSLRMYDCRLPAPVLAIFHNAEPLSAGLYQHIGGHPYIMIGGTKSEQIKVWDVRAKAPVYELSTGNNIVHALTWDAPRQTLYAATECSYMDRLGYYHGYRSAEFEPSSGSGSRTPDSDDEDVEESRHDYRCWPEDAYHLEQSFGHPLDCGYPRLFRYKYRWDTDVTVLPEYGSADLKGYDDFF